MGIELPSKSIFFLFVIAICVIFLISYAFSGSFAFWDAIGLALTNTAGVLRIGGQYPQVLKIYANASAGGAWAECAIFSESGCAFECLTDRTNTYRINATIYDANGDCNSFTNVRAYVCNQTYGKMDCNQNIDTYEVLLGSPSQFGTGGVYCNYTGTFGMEYFRRYGSWRINVTVFDTQNYGNSTVRNASYIQQPDLSYPYSLSGSGGTVDFGTVNIFDAFFVDSSKGNTTKNIGNVRLNVTYNASDFGCSGNYITINDNPANFAVANASSMTNPANYKYINGTQTIPVDFFATGGMRRCGNYLCSQDEIGFGTNGGYANYTIWWPINVPSGTVVCLPYYQNVITITRDAYTAAG